MTQAPDVDDAFAFAEEDEASPPVGASSPIQPPWQVLVVDDDPQVQLVTRLAFTHLQLDGRPLQLHVAASAAEARMLLSTRDEIAAAIVDVVMESESAGLELVKWIRQQSLHACTRVILRTGQPGFAPEESVLRDYDINDYWPKTELTAHRMRTLLTGQLRSWRDLRLIERQRNDLERVASGVSELFARDGLNALLEVIVAQVRALLDAPQAGVTVLGVGDASRMDGFALLAGDDDLLSTMTAEARRTLQESRRRGRLVLDDGRLALFAATGGTSATRGVALYATGVGSLEQWAVQALELLTRNALSVLSSQLLYEEQRSLLQAVERFVPDRLVRMAGADDVRQLKAGDHQQGRKWVLFADLRGFTTLSEKLSPSEVHATLQEVFAAVTPIVEGGQGVVDKFLGDGLLALFPGERPPPLATCHAMLAALDELNVRRVARGLSVLRLSMALHGGPVLLCVLGHERRIEITAVSDVVHDALAEPDRQVLRPLGRALVRGREGAIGIHDADPASQGAGFARRDELSSILHRIESGDPAARTDLRDLAGLYPEDIPLQALAARGGGTYS